MTKVGALSGPAKPQGVGSDVGANPVAPSACPLGRDIGRIIRADAAEAPARGEEKSTDLQVYCIVDFAF